MEPGLWKVSMKIKTEGKVFDAAREIRELLRELPQEEQAEVREFLSDLDGIDENGNLELCHTRDMMRRNESIIVHQDKECLSSVLRRTPAKVVSRFTCLDGTVGEDTLFIKGPRRYTGVTKVIDPSGEASEVVYQGDFISPLCESFDDVVI
jgi:hypothetical protein